jgi:hypothetical protein
MPKMAAEAEPQVETKEEREQEVPAVFQMAMLR